MLSISNFVLDIYNINLNFMKRSIVIFIIAALVLITTGLWILSPGAIGDPMEYLHFGVIMLIILFALFIGYKRLRSEKRGEPAEDELSKKVLQKTAAWSYYISLYIWVAMIYIKDRIVMDTEIMLGTGILAMAVTFAVCWMIFNFWGIRNE
jgi:peptidoglycan/LPS O-acetylase OafA/YrhL